ncbi:hypothetical protein ACJJTC_016270 [Scirpophaga incertulas]
MAKSKKQSREERLRKKRSYYQRKKQKERTATMLIENTPPTSPSILYNSNMDIQENNIREPSPLETPLLNSDSASPILGTSRTLKEPGILEGNHLSEPDANTSTVASPSGHQPISSFTITWNYSESGHGKGVPDGVGAIMKRTADRAVCQGQDIKNLDDFINIIDQNLKKVKLRIVSDYDVAENDLLFPQKVKSFPGCMKMHQLVWNLDTPTIAVRKLMPVQSLEFDNISEITFSKDEENEKLSVDLENINPYLLDSDSDEDFNIF